MRTIIFVLLSILCSCGSAQQKTEKEMETEKKQLKELIKQDMAMVTQYSEKPEYYVQVNKSGCRIIVKVDDIPLGYNFAEDEGQTMLYPINDRLFCSGEHTLSVEVYPLTTQSVVSVGTWVNLKVIHYPDKNGYDKDVIAELNVPNNIAAQKLPIYQSFLNFTATLPFNHKQVLASAQDLRKVPDLESKVLVHYKNVRNMMIAGNIYEYYKMRLGSTWVRTDMNYLTETDLEDAYLGSDELFRFDCNLIDWKAIPIENYEMVVCGNGKLVYLRRKGTLDEVLQVEYGDTEEKGEFVSTKFIALYMPQGSDELLELY